jgi:5-methylcytosine-specific restriction endonuclease McrA
VCGKPRKNFDKRHRDTPCCKADCTAEYWLKKTSWPNFRDIIFKQRGGICAKCKRELVTYPFPNKKHKRIETWTLDHILPIAMGGAMWDPANLQILCQTCNKAKTANDLGNIAAVKRMKHIALPDRNEAIERMRHTPIQSTLEVA